MSETEIKQFIYSRTSGELITLARIFGSKARTMRGIVAAVRRRLVKKGVAL